MLPEVLRPSNEAFRQTERSSLPMGTVAEASSTEEDRTLPVRHTSYSISTEPRSFGDPTTHWIEYAVHQAQLYQRVAEDFVESTIQSSKSRLFQIRSTSAAHFQQTLASLEDLTSEYGVYENIFFGKIKEGIFIAASHPLITCGSAAGLGFLVFKMPRRFLYYNTMRLFMSEESLLSKADAKVKHLRQSIDLLKAESEKLEKLALHAEEEMIRGRTKLRQTGKQIQSVIQSAYKIQRQTGGLKEIIEELPRREASRFRTQVSNLAKEAKRESCALSKEVSKISNYGISI